NAKHVLAWIQRKRVDRFSERDAYQGTKGRFKKVAELRPTLELLVSHGHIRECPRPQQRGPGRPPGIEYEVHPDLRAHFEDIGNIGVWKGKCDFESPPTPEVDIGAREPGQPPSFEVGADEGAQNSISPPYTQNSQNPQNSDDEEVAL